jgi:copper transport protein
MLHRRLSVFTTLFWLVSLIPTPAWSHASLLGTVPENGAVLAEPPTTISLRFNEPVSPVRLQLLDGQGKPVTLIQASAEGNTLHYTPESMPIEGQFLLSYRVLSMDAHPISGSVGFAVGDMPAPVAHVLATADTWTVIMIRSVRTLLLISMLGCTGLVLFPLLFTQPASLESWRRKWLGRLCVTGFCAAIIGLGLWGVLLAEASLFDIYRQDIWTLANSTTLAKSTVMVVLGLVLILLSIGSPSGLGTRLLGGGGVLIAGIGLVSSGHAAGAPTLLSPVFLIHIVMAGIWFGSLAMLLAVTSQCADDTSTKVLKQFSPRAMVMVVILLLCAAILGWYQLDTVGALFTSDYGRWLLLKTGLVTVILVLAILNCWRFTPAMEAGRANARKHLHSAIRVETIVMITVIALTTVLASTPPPEKTGPQSSYTATTTADTALNVQLTMAPAKTGSNRVELTFTNSQGPVVPQEVTLRWLNTGSGIEPLSQTIKGDANGIYRTENLDLLVAGDWEFRVEALIDDFTLRRFELTIPIEN